MRDIEDKPVAFVSILDALFEINVVQWSRLRHGATSLLSLTAEAQRAQR
jgi:hypothetical protein